MVDELLHDPGADPARIVPPAAGAGAVGEAKEIERDALQIADVAGVDDAFDGAPLLRQTQLVADRQHAARAASGLDEAIARGERRRQRLLEQHVLARLERGDADLLVQIVGDHDVDRVDVPASEQGAVIELDDGIRPVPARDVRRLAAAARDCGERGAGRLRDGARVIAAEEAVADEAEAQGHVDCALPSRLVLDPPRLGDPSRRIENLE